MALLAVLFVVNEKKSTTLAENTLTKHVSQSPDYEQRQLRKRQEIPSEPQRNAAGKGVFQSALP